MLLTTPQKTAEVTQYLCTQFDTRIRMLYKQEDLAQGYITSKDREGTEKKFPIMTVSLAGVTNTQRPLSSYAEVTNICAELKKKAKEAARKSGKSALVLDQRRGTNAPARKSAAG